MAKKLRMGWFSFSCSEDSSILFVELMNERFFDWAEKIEFAHCRILKAKNDLSNLDVAFVEGAIASEHDELKLKEIRQNCKYLVAIGSCAVSGMPSAQRNFFDEKNMAEIRPILQKFGHRDKVAALKELVQVDDEVPGCPMDESVFLQVLDKYLKQFGVG
ncbi:F420-non-reducing hydrogenase subunit G [uncultured archaeon]|nr:F420-non-reducing hydrogenase subunit G [uncultured archaeon]